MKKQKNKLPENIVIKISGIKKDIKTLIVEIKF